MLTISNSDIGSNAVYCFSKSKHNLLWIGNEEGLCYYSYKDKRIRRLPVIINGKHLKYIHDIYETKNSELWIASVGMGIVKAQLTGSPDTPRLEDMRIYTINEGQIGSNYFFTITMKTKTHLFLVIKVMEYSDTMRKPMYLSLSLPTNMII